MGDIFGLERIAEDEGTRWAKVLHRMEWVKLEGEEEKVKEMRSGSWSSKGMLQKRERFRKGRHGWR